MFIDLREKEKERERDRERDRERERERERCAREKRQLVASWTCPDQE